MAQVTSKLLVLGCVALFGLISCKPILHPFDKLPILSSGDDAKPAGAAEMQQPAADPAPPPKLPAPNEIAAPTQDESPTKIVKIGLLVPLSGRSGTIGKALQDAGILALFDKYAALSGPASRVRVELIPKDTEGTPSGAKKAAAEAMKEGVKLIIGPLYGHSVEAIKPLAKTGKISVLSFSNNTAVAGDGVYVMGFNPAHQARRIASYTYVHEVNRLAVLTPNDVYGRRVLEAVRQVAKEMDRKVKPIVHYSTAGATISEDVKKLIDLGKISGHINFEALFLPEGSELLGQIINRLQAEGVSSRNVRFIGTGLWDDRDLIRIYNLEGAWLASSPPDMYSAFEQRFINSYGYKPPRIASLAYDAVALAATLATTTNDFSREAISDPNGYSGPANGIFRFHKDGLVERGLAVMEVQNSQFKVIDPAPVSFVPLNQ